MTTVMTNSPTKKGVPLRVDFHYFLPLEDGKCVKEPGTPSWPTSDTSGTWCTPCVSITEEIWTEYRAAKKAMEQQELRMAAIIEAEHKKCSAATG